MYSYIYYLLWCRLLLKCIKSLIFVYLTVLFAINSIETSTYLSKLHKNKPLKYTSVRILRNIPRHSIMYCRWNFTKFNLCVACVWNVYWNGNRGITLINDFRAPCQLRRRKGKRIDENNFPAFSEVNENSVLFPLVRLFILKKHFWVVEKIITHHMAQFWQSNKFLFEKNIHYLGSVTEVAKIKKAVTCFFTFIYHSCFLQIETLLEGFRQLVPHY